MVRFLASVALAALVLVSVAPAVSADGCASPPCGPIPVVINIKLDKWKGLTFEAQDELTFDGTVSFYVNVDQDGWWYDQQSPPVMTFRVNRQPPWIRTTIEPDNYVVPVSDPTFLGPEGSNPNEVQFYWEAPVTIKVRKIAEPTPEDLASDSPYIRRDGTFRITTSATTTASILGGAALGPNLGLQEGYGVRELRFIPEIDGVQWLPNELGVLGPGGQAPEPEGSAPAPLAPLLVVLMAAVAFALRRRNP